MSAGWWKSWRNDGGYTVSRRNVKGKNETKGSSNKKKKKLWWLRIWEKAKEKNTAPAPSYASGRQLQILAIKKRKKWTELNRQNQRMQVDYISCCRPTLKGIGHCRVVTGRETTWQASRNDWGDQENEDRKVSAKDSRGGKVNLNKGGFQKYC